MSFRSFKRLSQYIDDVSIDSVGDNNAEDVDHSNGNHEPDGDNNPGGDIDLGVNDHPDADEDPSTCNQLLILFNAIDLNGNDDIEGDEDPNGDNYPEDDPSTMPRTNYRLFTFVGADTIDPEGDDDRDGADDPDADDEPTALPGTSYQLSTFCADGANDPGGDNDPDSHDARHGDNEPDADDDPGISYRLSPLFDIIPTDPDMDDEPDLDNGADGVKEPNDDDDESMPGTSSATTLCAITPKIPVRVVPRHTERRRYQPPVNPLAGSTEQQRPYITARRRLPSGQHKLADGTTAHRLQSTFLPQIQSSATKQLKLSTGSLLKATRPNTSCLALSRFSSSESSLPKLPLAPETASQRRLPLLMRSAGNLKLVTIYNEDRQSLSTQHKAQDLGNPRKLVLNPKQFATTQPGSSSKSGRTTQYQKGLQQFADVRGEAASSHVLRHQLQPPSGHLRAQLPQFSQAAVTAKRCETQPQSRNRKMPLKYEGFAMEKELAKMLGEVSTPRTTQPIAFHASYQVQQKQVYQPTRCHIPTIADDVSEQSVHDTTSREHNYARKPQTRRAPMCYFKQPMGGVPSQSGSSRPLGLPTIPTAHRASSNHTESKNDVQDRTRLKEQQRADVLYLENLLLESTQSMHPPAIPTTKTADPPKPMKARYVKIRRQSENTVQILINGAEQPVAGVPSHSRTRQSMYPAAIPKTSSAISDYTLPTPKNAGYVKILRHSPYTVQYPVQGAENPVAIAPSQPSSRQSMRPVANPRTRRARSDLIEGAEQPIAVPSQSCSRQSMRPVAIPRTRCARSDRIEGAEQPIAVPSQSCSRQSTRPVAIPRTRCARSDRIEGAEQPITVRSQSCSRQSTRPVAIPRTRRARSDRIEGAEQPVAIPSQSWSRQSMCPLAIPNINIARAILGSRDLNTPFASGHEKDYSESLQRSNRTHVKNFDLPSNQRALRSVETEEQLEPSTLETEERVAASTLETEERVASSSVEKEEHVEPSTVEGEEHVEPSTVEREEHVEPSTVLSDEELFRSIMESEERVAPSTVEREEHIEPFTVLSEEELLRSTMESQEQFSRNTASLEKPVVPSTAPSVFGEDGEREYYGMGEETCACMNIHCPGCWSFGCHKCGSTRCGPICNKDIRFGYHVVRDSWTREPLYVCTDEGEVV